MAAATQEITDPRNLAAASRDDVAEEEATMPVIFVVTQSETRANGGVESISQVLQNARRVKPIVITQSETAATRRWRDAGCEVQLWDLSGRDVRKMPALEANLRMFRLVRSSQCRLVHCNDISALWHTAFGARLAGAKVIFNVRNIKPASQRYGWRWQMARRVSQRQIVLSREMQRELGARLGVANGHRHEIDYVYSAVDPVCFSPADEVARNELRARLGIEGDRFAVGCVASFDPRKGQLEFIKESGPLLKQLVPQAKIYFIGDFTPEKNDYARRCRDAATELNLNASIVFVDYTPDVSDWYRALDVVVVASRNEGLARCMIESLACGTPVVSFDVCSAREILEDHYCGLVRPQGDYEKLVEAIETLAKRADLRRQFGAAGVTTARELFNPARIVDRYEDLYFSLIN